MSGIVQSLDRALTILEILSENITGLGISEISTIVGLHKSTVHRLLGTLIQKGFVEQDEISSKYYISLKLYELGMRRIEAKDILSASRPFTKKLMETVNEVVHLVIRDENDIIYIDKVEANNNIRMASSIGKRSPLYCTSVGKAILAQLTVEEVKQVWETSNIIKRTENTIVDFTRFQKELDLVKENGFAEDDEENEKDVRCIGAPVFNSKNEVEGAISISGPAIRVTKGKVAEIAGEVKKYAMLISKELGYRSPV